MVNRKLAVAVARDVLAQLKAKRYVPIVGDYVSIQKYLDLSDYDLDFRKFFKNNETLKCKVCALGSCFVSLINLKNEATVGDVGSLAGMENRLDKVFGKIPVELMESAYERRDVRDCRYDRPSLLDISEVNAAIKWGRRYRNNTKRLEAIMRNIIRNNGEFKLPKKR